MKTSSSHLSKQLPLDKRIFLCLDTNVYCESCFDSRFLDKLESLTTRLAKVTLLLPDVVLKECEHGYRRRIPFVPRKIERLRCIPRDLAEFRKHVDAQIANAYEGHWSQWSRRIREISEVFQFTDAQTGAAFRRIMEKRPPCHKEDAIRDAVIWESLLAVIKRDDAIGVFVTRDSDFPFEHDTPFRDEAESAGVYCFKSIHEAEVWLCSVRVDTTKPFEEWYEDMPCGLIDDYTYEVIENWLIGSVTHFGYFWEILDADLEDCKIELVDEPDNGVKEYETIEVWNVRVSFLMEAEHHIGGRDGADYNVSDEEITDGTIRLRRTVKVSSGRVESNIEEILDLDFDYEDNWDPHEAWLDSLASDRLENGG